MRKLKNGEPATIVAFGDSITEGYCVRRGYVSFWEDDLRKRYPGGQLTMVNAGRSGDTTFDGVARMRQDVVSRDPDLVTVQFGLNDCFSTVYRSEFRENLLWIVRRIEEETRAEAVLMTSVLPPLTRDQVEALRYFDVIRQFGVERKLPVFQMDVAWRNAIRSEEDLRRYALDDGVHPSEAGYRLIADALMRFMCPADSETESGTE